MANDIEYLYNDFGQVANEYQQHGAAAASSSPQVLYGYDLAGNRFYRRDEVARASSAKFAELYAYDQLNRLRKRKLVPVVCPH